MMLLSGELSNRLNTNCSLTPRCPPQSIYIYIYIYMVYVYIYGYIYTYTSLLHFSGCIHEFFISICLLCQLASCESEMRDMFPENP